MSSGVRPSSEGGSGPGGSGRRPERPLVEEYQVGDTRNCRGEPRGTWGSGGSGARGTGAPKEERSCKGCSSRHSRVEV